MSTRCYVTLATMCSLMSVCACACGMKDPLNTGFMRVLVPRSKGSTEVRIVVANSRSLFGELSGLTATSGSDCGPRSPDSTVVVADSSSEVGLRFWVQWPYRVLHI